MCVRREDFDQQGSLTYVKNVSNGYKSVFTQCSFSYSLIGDTATTNKNPFVIMATRKMVPIC